MIEPVTAEHFLASFVSAAVVILSGAGYAALFAWARLGHRRWTLVAAYLSYAVLVGAVAILAVAANLNGLWRSVVAVMLVGYLLAPHAIWRLCAATHTEPPET